MPNPSGVELCFYIFILIRVDVMGVGDGKTWKRLVRLPPPAIVVLGCYLRPFNSFLKFFRQDESNLVLSVIISSNLLKVSFSKRLFIKFWYPFVVFCFFVFGFIGYFKIGCLTFLLLTILLGAILAIFLLALSSNGGMFISLKIFFVSKVGFFGFASSIYKFSFDTDFFLFFYILSLNSSWPSPSPDFASIF